MEASDELRAKIADFPGYGNDIELRRSDEYVRAYLGEALASIGTRCTLAPDVRQRLDDLLLRVQFADPRAFAAHRIAGEIEPEDGVRAVARADVATVELADRAASVDAESAAGFLEEAVAALDERAAALRAVAMKMA